MAKEIPTKRELAVYAQLLRPNRHDKKRLTEQGIGNGKSGRWFASFGYKEIPKRTEDVRLVKKGVSRFEVEFAGWVKIGDWDWIWTHEDIEGNIERLPNMHFDDHSGSAKMNIVSLDEKHFSMPNPSQAAAPRMAAGPSVENPFE